MHTFLYLPQAPRPPSSFATLWLCSQQLAFSCPISWLAAALFWVPWRGERGAPDREALTRPPPTRQGLVGSPSFLVTCDILMLSSNPPPVHLYETGMQASVFSVSHILWQLVDFCQTQVSSLNPSQVVLFTSGLTKEARSQSLSNHKMG